MATPSIKAPSKKRWLREHLDMGNGFTPYMLVLPTILLILGVGGCSLLNSLWLSFLNDPPGPGTDWIGWSNYIELFMRSDS
ncbi:MAG TPA: hypothetical protein VGT82_08370, partial [Ktedonobacteraceae bacterium]|nr:hypothetical protein [Ktedonobacteraceae bacterium]